MTPMQSLSGANVQEQRLGSIGREDGDASALHADATLDQVRQAGRAAGAVLADVRRDPSLVVHLRRRTRALREVIYSGLSNASLSRLHQDWLVGNARLIVSAEKELRPFPASTRGFPVVQRALPEPALRVCALAELCLDTLQGRFEQERFVAFVHGVQERCELEMGEVWAAKPALQLVILERIVQAVVANRAELPALITSLRAICESRWKETFSAINVVDPVLDRDPLGAYAAMDDDSRDHYRNVVTEVAKHSSLSEREVAETAVELARDACARGPAGRAAERRAHVGFYLIDGGLKRLKARVAYRPPLRQRIVDVACARPTLFYVGGAMMTTIALVLVVLAALGPAAALGAIVLLVVAPATQAAVDVMNNLVAWLMKPRRLPKLDFSDGIPDGCATLVAVPAILLNEQHVRELVMDQEIRYLANRDANLSFALVTNSPDSVQPAEERHEVLSLCERLIRELNERYGTHNRTPFYLFHRFRAFNPSEGRWMGWERKRGKLFDLNQLLGGVRDRFPVKIGDLRWLPKVRYVITLDSDTELPRDAALRLVGALAHPLNRAVVDPQTQTVVEGYGILQPRISVSTQSATRSWLASLYSGDVGFDVYTRAISDVYQDLFGEGNFTGKGIYEVDTFRESLERRFPTNTLLSHDLIEGVFARAGLVSDIELIEDYPTHFSAYCRRKHRWMRGDWQLLRWLLNSVPDYRQRLCSQSADADFAVEDTRQSSAQPFRAGSPRAAAHGLVRASGIRGGVDRVRPRAAVRSGLYAPAHRDDPRALVVRCLAAVGGRDSCLLPPHASGHRTARRLRAARRLAGPRCHRSVAGAHVRHAPPPAGVGDGGRGGTADTPRRNGCLSSAIAVYRGRHWDPAVVDAPRGAPGGGPDACALAVIGRSDAMAESRPEIANR